MDKFNEVIDLEGIYLFLYILYTISELIHAKSTMVFAVFSLPAVRAVEV